MDHIPAYWWWISLAVTAIGVLFTILRWWQGLEAKKEVHKIKEEIKETKDAIHDNQTNHD